MDERLGMANADGEWATAPRSNCAAFPLGVFIHARECLDAMGKPSHACDELIKGVADFTASVSDPDTPYQGFVHKSSQEDGNAFNEFQRACPGPDALSFLEKALKSQAAPLALMAANWAAREGKTFAKLPLRERYQRCVSLGFSGYDFDSISMPNTARHYTSTTKNSAFPLGDPELNACNNKKELLDPNDRWSTPRFDAMMFQLPGKASADKQKARSFDADEMQQLRLFQAKLPDLSVLLKNACDELLSHGLCAPKMDPFEKTRAAWSDYSSKSFESQQTIMQGGSLWVAACDSGSGIEYCSPNRSLMKDIARAKTFGTYEEAIAFGGEGALELRWTLQSVKVSPRADAKALRALSSALESKSISEAVSSGPDQANAPAKTSRKRI